MMTSKEVSPDADEALNYGFRRLSLNPTSVGRKRKRGCSKEVGKDRITCASPHVIDEPELLPRTKKPRINEESIWSSPAAPEKAAEKEKSFRTRTKVENMLPSAASNPQLLPRTKKTKITKEERIGSSPAAPEKAAEKEKSFRKRSKVENMLPSAASNPQLLPRTKKTKITKEERIGSSPAAPEKAAEKEKSSRKRTKVKNIFPSAASKLLVTELLATVWMFAGTLIMYSICIIRVGNLKSSD